MRLEPVKDDKFQMTRCYYCAQSLALRDAVADLDGPAFQAYYHPACATEAARDKGFKTS